MSEIENPGENKAALWSIIANHSLAAAVGLYVLCTLGVFMAGDIIERLTGWDTTFLQGWACAAIYYAMLRTRQGERD